MNTATVTASKLNVRSAPVISGNLVSELGRGTRVDVIARAGSWYEIKAGSVHGFVHGDFLHLDSTPTASGFLCHDDGLCAAELEPPAERRIAGSGLSPQARGAAEAWNRFGGMLQPLCDVVAIPPATAVAVLCVESSGRGFANGRMIIRFENHVFWDQWGKNKPDRFRQHFTFDSAKRWTGHRFRTTASGAMTNSHAGQASEWQAFELARSLNGPAALRSISMGLPQIMGFNHPLIGYDSAGGMFDRFSENERFQILGLFDFIKGAGPTSRMLEALRRGQYVQFATHYNGNGQAATYGERIRSVVEAFAPLVPA